jgi:DNA-binding IscR family transcriptional regulator
MCEECVDPATCGIRFLMKDTRDAIASVLDRESLAALVERVDKAKRGGGDPMFYI